MLNMTINVIEDEIPKIDETNRLYNEGKNAYQVSNYQEALAKWKKGLEISIRSVNTNAMLKFLHDSQGVNNFNPLPAVPAELEGIVRKNQSDPDGVLPGTIRIDKKFTQKGLEDALDEKNQVMHIASHFVFHPGTQHNSYYLLLGDNCGK